MNVTYLRIDLVRQVRDWGNIMFVLLMPVVMYLIFGVSMSYADQQAGNANVSFYVMTSMAAYGGALAATTVAGGAALEQMQGWGRQLALTPVRNSMVVAMKVVTALCITTLSIALVYLTGYLAGAKADSARVWVLSFLVTLVGATTFALFGYMVAALFKSESALGVATGFLVLMSFVGNVFMPLTGTMLEVAKFTPLYGYVALARWPNMEGTLVDGQGSDSFWMLLLNLVVWLAVFGGLAIWGVKRGQKRQ
ncbi:ABC transporter permease [Jonesiaceae bacterium BS-20]|uniref:ABC transporter permease n=1 Tax=Jonesiaceae bacterium BS-20 TaxID=3120821 RepID=A0AAU7DVG3_9MICO